MRERFENLDLLEHMVFALSASIRASVAPHTFASVLFNAKLAQYKIDSPA